MKKHFIALVYFVLIAGPLLVFWQVRHFDFINYDDPLYVSKNPHVIDGFTVENIRWAFTTPNGGNWLPLTWLSFMLDCQIAGVDPGWMHCVNLLLHILNTVLLFAVFKKMTGTLGKSAFVAAAFALHPMHVESVAWITERKDVLSGLFCMLTLAAYIGYVRRGSLSYFLAAVFLFLLAVLAKPMLVTLPFMLLLLDYWPLNRLDSCNAVQANGTPDPAPVKRRLICRVIIEKIPFFAMVAVFCGITYLAQRSSGAVPDINVLSLGSRISNIFLSYTRYISKLFWPQNLSVIYPFDIKAFASWQIALCALFLLAVSIAVILWGRKQKYLPVGWFWFLGTLVPVIGLIQSGAQPYADRYTYIPYIGLFIMIAWGLPQLLLKWRYWKFAAGAGALASLTACGLAAYRQVSYWENTPTLFTHAIEVTQNNAVAHNCLGVYWSSHNNTALAVTHISRAAELGFPEAQYNLGVMYEKGEGLPRDCKQAARWYTQAANQGNAPSLYNLGVLYYAGQDIPQDYEKAAALWLQAARLGFVSAQYNIALLYSKGQGIPQDYKEAFRWYTAAAQGESVPAQYALGMMYYIGQGIPQDYEKAARWFTVTARQGILGAQINLGLMYAQGQGVAQDSVQAYRWWSLAAAQGNEDAAKNLELLSQGMTPAQIAQAKQLYPEKEIDNRSEPCAIP